MTEAGGGSMAFTRGDRVRITSGDDSGRFAVVEEDGEIAVGVGRMVSVVLDGWGTRIMLRPGWLVLKGVYGAAQNKALEGGGAGSRGGMVDAGHPVTGGAERVQ